MRKTEPVYTYGRCKIDPASAAVVWKRVGLDYTTFVGCCRNWSVPIPDNIGSAKSPDRSLLVGAFVYAKVLRAIGADIASDVGQAIMLHLYSPNAAEGEGERPRDRMTALMDAARRGETDWHVSAHVYVHPVADATSVGVAVHRSTDLPEIPPVPDMRLDGIVTVSLERALLFEMIQPDYVR